MWGNQPCLMRLRTPIDAQNFPFCTIEPNKGIVPVPDNRLDKLAKNIQHAKYSPCNNRVY